MCQVQLYFSSFNIGFGRAGIGCGGSYLRFGNANSGTCAFLSCQGLFKLHFVVAIVQLNQDIAFFYFCILFKPDLLDVSANAGNNRTDVAINLCIIGIHVFAVIDVRPGAEYGA
ncbi:hypothetical protein D3C87_1739890 [compost metagenome]